MKNLPFKKSKDLSVGVELEYQIINPITFNLTHQSQLLLNNIPDTSLNAFTIKPEIMQSMIEVNSSVHDSINSLTDELRQIQKFLRQQSQELNLLFCGGGTHPFQKILENKIFPTVRYEHFFKEYQYLTHRTAVFSLQIHIGCAACDDAIYLIHAFSRYIPQLIAMSASSPFFEGIDTGYFSTRMLNFNSSFPSYGCMPFVTQWREFSNYFYKMKTMGIIESMKDFHWEIRPKPDFGTIEIRVCDVPLTFKKVIMIVAYIQSLAAYLLNTKPISISQDLYMLYNYNKFYAMRYGLDAIFIEPYTHKKCFIYEDILKTIENINFFAESLDNQELIAQLKHDVINKTNDTKLLRELFNKTNSLKEVVKQECILFMDDF